MIQETYRVSFSLVEILDQSIEYIVRVGFEADVVVPSERGVDSAYLNIIIEGREAHFVQDRLSIYIGRITDDRRYNRTISETPPVKYDFCRRASGALYSLTKRETVGTAASHLVDVLTRAASSKGGHQSRIVTTAAVTWVIVVIFAAIALVVIIGRVIDIDVSVSRAVEDFTWACA